MIKDTTLNRPPWPPADPFEAAARAIKSRVEVLVENRVNTLERTIRVAETRASIALVIAGAALIAALLR